MKFLGIIKDGKLTVENKQALSVAIKKNEGKWFELVLGKKERSLNQNNYYWGVIIQMIYEHTGQDQDTIHDYFKTKFLKRTVNFNGKEVCVVGSTASLSTIEFEQYVEKCRLDCAEMFNLEIPLPNEYGTH